MVFEVLNKAGAAGSSTKIKDLAFMVREPDLWLSLRVGDVEQVSTSVCPRVVGRLCYSY